MNELKVKGEHEGLRYSPIVPFDSIIDNSIVHIESTENIIFLRIITRKKEEATKRLFFDVFTLIFIYLGAFPVIKEFLFNNELLKTTNLAGKFTSRSDLFRKDLFVININSDSVNQRVIDTYRRKQSAPLSSLQYLASESYKHIVSDHRITLLLHVIDGICDVKTTDIKKEIVRKYRLGISYKEIGDYLAKAYEIVKGNFFYYHRIFDCGIMKLLHVTQYDFLTIISDTRNWNSHFLRDKKPNRLKGGAEIVIYFELIMYIIRLKLAKDFEVPVKEDNIKEYYYTVHDWILNVLYDREDDIKSVTYRNAKNWNEFIECMKRLSTDDTVTVDFKK